MATTHWGGEIKHRSRLEIGADVLGGLSVKGATRFVLSVMAVASGMLGVLALLGIYEGAVIWLIFSAIAGITSVALR